MLRRPKENGQSFIEYVVVIMLVMGAFLVFQKYIVRGFAGRWKAVGESLGQGRVYDPKMTTECIFDSLYTNLWYDQACFKSRGCDCLSVLATTVTCQDCFNPACVTVICNN